jgi:hypothetical protein
MRVFLDNNVPVGVARLLSHHTVALVVLGSNIWPIVREYAASILAAVEAVQPGSFEFIEMQLPPKV